LQTFVIIKGVWKIKINFKIAVLLKKSNKKYYLCAMNKNLSFSGHESFACKYFWLKKGYDFICDAHSFTKADAVMQLGVGKNMVSAIRFWLRAFGLTNDKDELQDIAHTIFKDDNGDPYLEDIGTVWLLHYLLVTTDRASIYSFVFNDFRKNHIEFSRDDLMRAIEYKCKEIDKSHIYNTNTVTTDISVFIRNYQRKHQKVVALNIEDDFSGILLDLNLLKMVDRADTKEMFYFNTEHRTIPLEILCIWYFE
jgi:Protein of unknown function (DUF4007)